MKTTTIITPFRLFEFPLTSFGLGNAAQSFHRIMDEFLETSMIASRDDIQHKQLLRLIFNSLREYGVDVNTAKIIFGVSE